MISSVSYEIERVKNKSLGGSFRGRRATPSWKSSRLRWLLTSVLALYDIRGSLAHCRMLVKQKILTRAEGEKIGKGLAQVQRELERRRLSVSALG